MPGRPAIKRSIQLWTEQEVAQLVQAWTEVAATYKRGGGRVKEKIWSWLVRQYGSHRSAVAIERCMTRIRHFIRFVHQFDTERQQSGACSWFDLDSSEQKRIKLPKGVRGITREAFDALTKAGIVARCIHCSPRAVATPQTRKQACKPKVPRPICHPNDDANQGGLAAQSSLESLVTPDVAVDTPPTEVGTPNNGYEAEGSGNRTGPFGPMESSNATQATSTRSSRPSPRGLEPLPQSKPSSEQPRAPRSSPRTSVVKRKTKRKARAKFKHRDCNILLENMVELQSRQFRRILRELSGDIEFETQRNMKAVSMVISERFGERGSNGDAAFVARLVDSHQRHMSDRFARLWEDCSQLESTHRALLGQRFGAPDQLADTAYV